MMILYFWKGLLIAQAHGSNKKKARSLLGSGPLLSAYCLTKIVFEWILDVAVWDSLDLRFQESWSQKPNQTTNISANITFFNALRVLLHLTYVIRFKWPQMKMGFFCLILKAEALLSQGINLLCYVIFVMCIISVIYISWQLIHFCMPKSLRWLRAFCEIMV